jgi:hypothetical protein
LVKQLSRLWKTHECRETKVAARKKKEKEESREDQGGDGWSEEGDDNRHI